MDARLTIGVLLVLGAGCSHRCYVHSLGSEEYASLKQHARQGECTVVMRTGARYLASALEVGVDSTVFHLERAGGMTRASTQDVQEIIFTRRALGALKGFGVGAAVAGGLGALAGLVVREDAPEQCGWGLCVERSAVVGTMAAVLAPVGGLIGAITGASLGDKVIYYPFPEDASEAYSDSLGRVYGADEELSNKPLQQTAPRPPTPRD